MASDIINEDEPKERDKWEDNSIVYTRRKCKKSPDFITENVTVSATTNTCKSPPKIRNNSADVAGTTSPARKNNNEGTIKKSDKIPQKTPQTLATVQANSSQQQQAPPDINEILIQEKQAKVTAPKGSVRSNENIAVKPIITRVDNNIRINLKNKRSKKEIRDLKRKFSVELDQVRSVIKRLEDVSSVAQYRPLSVYVLENNDFGELGEKEKRTPKANRYYQNSNFLLSNDRLPLEIIIKRVKSSGGKKHGNRFGVNTYINRAFKGCSNLLTMLMKHKYGWVFNKTVDVEAFNLHEYHNVIKKPMDLGTIKARISRHLYKFPIEFAEDIKLTFNNAMTYNQKGHEVYDMAEELLKLFEAKWPAIESDYNIALSLLTPTLKPSNFRNLEVPEKKLLLPRAPVLKKPKARDLYKRIMTYDEKQKLSSNLDSLPPEKLDDIVKIMKKRNLEFSQNDEVIELDIDSVDTETLWELDRFVLNFKKNVNKMKRKADIALQAGSGVIPPVSTSLAPTAMKSPEPSEIGEKSDAIPSPKQGEREGDDVSRSSGSSSSSSGSGFSTDSDSDSSSSNGIEGGGSPKLKRN